MRGYATYGALVLGLGLVLVVPMSSRAGLVFTDFSGYLGGTMDEFGIGVSTDAAGNVYLVGQTRSADFPTTPGAFDRILNGGEDAFAVKIDSSGRNLVYSTFLGGSLQSDIAFSIAVDSDGSAYIGGSTASADFPTTPGAVDSSFGGFGGAFVVKLDANGNLIFATSLDVINAVEVRGIDLDPDGSVLVAGTTGSGDVIVAKLSADGSALAYSTVLGGSSFDFGRAIDSDPSGNAYIVGIASSPDFPTTAGAFDPTCCGAFLAKLDPAGGIVFSTFLGGTGSADATSVAVDPQGNAFVTGSTGSPDFPATEGAFDEGLSGGIDAYVAKFDGTGSLAYATFIGGAGAPGSGEGEEGRAIAVDSSGNAYVTGITFSADFPVTAGALDPRIGTGDAFVTKLNATGTGLVYSSFLGGSDGGDQGNAIAVDGFGNAYVVGYTFSTNFPTTPGFIGDSDRDGVFADAFLSKIAFRAPPIPLPLPLLP